MNKLLIFKTLILGLAITTHANAFEVYQFLRWGNYTTANQKLVQTKNTDEFNNYLKTKNIKPIKVVTMGFILSNNQADPKKIKRIADESKLNPQTPICFDIEPPFRHDPKRNLPVILDALKFYHQFGGAAPIGVYGVLPQLTPNAYLSADKKASFSKLNDQYAEIANHVNILYPTLYYYNLTDMNVWNDKAKFNIKEAQRFANQRNLKIIPFLSTSNWKISSPDTMHITPLSEQDMYHSLSYIKELGADGVVLWEKAKAKQASDNKPAVFDIQNNAYKAIVKFSIEQAK
ncbi:hypothetical protein [Acinetobacter sp. CWB-B33]|jgi:hypothetical protein|uniref:hypothetical protein n=1 Tax=Acinetobacter sp. CWB-B33 TaxID=2815724 RepID=UPI0031FEC2BD